jgi:hypothetical protein
MKKNIFNILISCFVALSLFTSCEKELMSYEGVEGVYFAVQSGASYGSEKTWPYMPYTNLEFVKFPGADATVNLKVMITGPVKDYDRPFKVALNPDSTTAQQGVHFEDIPAEGVIKANEWFTYVPIVVKRAQDLRTAVKKIGVKLLPNEHFALSFTDWDAVAGFTAGTVIENFDASLHTINLSDFIVKPAVWTGSVNAQNKEAGIWGAFSEKKLNMICARFNLTYNDFMSTTTMPTVLQMLIYQTMSRDLIELYQLGTPVLEDDGRLMYFGGCPWESFIGVPWIR